MELLAQLEKIRSPFLTNLMRIFTELGAEIAVIAVICAIYWCYNKKFAYQIAFSLFISALMVQSLKITFRIPRPWVRFPGLNPVQEVIKTATGYSFPSGHTQSTTALYMTLLLYARNRIAKVGCGLMIFGVAFSRMYLGMHTLQDVTTSFLLTSAVVLLVYRLSNVRITEKLRIVIVSLMVTGSMALLIYSIRLNHEGIIEDAFSRDSCQAAMAGIGLVLGWYIETRYIQFDVKLKDQRLQIIKYIVGIGIALMLKLLIKLALGDTIFISSMTNMILILWVLAGYPWILKKIIMQHKEKEIGHL